MSEEPVPAEDLAKLFRRRPEAPPQTIAKAVTGATGALVTAITTALADGEVTPWELVLGVLMAIGAGAAVWATSNKP